MTAISSRRRGARWDETSGLKTSSRTRRRGFSATISGRSSWRSFHPGAHGAAQWDRLHRRQWRPPASRFDSVRFQFYAPLMMWPPHTTPNVLFETRDSRPHHRGTPGRDDLSVTSCPSLRRTGTPTRTATGIGASSCVPELRNGPTSHCQHDGDARHARGGVLFVACANVADC